MPAPAPHAFAVALILLVGACGASTEACSAENCSGCCLPLAGCVLPEEQSSETCGAGGDACASCFLGATCTPSGTCAARGCAGCVNEEGACIALEQQSSSQCGWAGTACGACAGGEECAEGRCGGQCRMTRRTGCR